MSMVMVRQARGWRGFLLADLESGRFTVRGQARARRAGSRLARTWAPMAPTRSMWVTARTDRAVMIWARAACRATLNPAGTGSISGREPVASVIAIRRIG